MLNSQVGSGIVFAIPDYLWCPYKKLKQLIMIYIPVFSWSR